MKEVFITYSDFSEMVSSCYYWGGERDVESTHTECNELNIAVRNHAIEFAVWCSGNMGASIELFSPEEQHNFYQQYLETL